MGTPAGKKVLFFVDESYEDLELWCPKIRLEEKSYKGKNVTGVSVIRDDLVDAGATFHDRPVVVDGNLIGSRTPKDLPDSCRAIIDALHKC